MTPIRVVGRKQKFLSFLKSEEGNADRSKVLVAGAVLGGSVMAQLLLAPAAHAGTCFTVDDCTNGEEAGLDQVCRLMGCNWSCPAPHAPGTCYDYS